MSLLRRIESARPASDVTGAGMSSLPAPLPGGDGANGDRPPAARPNPSLTGANNLPQAVPAGSVPPNGGISTGRMLAQVPLRESFRDAKFRIQQRVIGDLDPKLDLSNQEDFFKQVYAAARRIGWGHTTTYGTLAKELGAGPEAARDVGQAMAKNPVALIIPCHRVLAAGNKIGGFSAPGGSNSKQRMLELEGVQVAPPKPVQQSLAL